MQDDSYQQYARTNNQSSITYVDILCENNCLNGTQKCQVLNKANMCSRLNHVSIRIYLINLAGGDPYSFFLAFLHVINEIKVVQLCMSSNNDILI